VVALPGNDCIDLDIDDAWNNWKSGVECTAKRDVTSTIYTIKALRRNEIGAKKADQKTGCSEDFQDYTMICKIYFT